MKNKNKNSKAILKIVIKDPMFKRVDKRELLGYIEGAKEFVRYMGRTGNESINGKMGPEQYHKYLQYVFDTQFKTPEEKKMKKSIIKKINKSQKKKGLPVFKESINEVSDKDVESYVKKKGLKDASLPFWKVEFFWSPSPSPKYDYIRSETPKGALKVAKQHHKGAKFGKVVFDDDYFLKVNKNLKEGYGVFESINEGRYHAWRNDETLSPKQKIGIAMRETRDNLTELERVVRYNVRLKNEMKVDSRDYWKNTHKALSKISERLVRLANKVGQLH